MALKDMKSDLSKFRMPKKEPLQSKERVDVNKNLNKTPLSSMAESAPKIPRSTTTVNKEGVNPQKVNQSEKFKGETSPQPMDNSEKFLGETTPKPMSLEERYLGQTDPTKANNSEQFLGETTPKSMNNQSQFLGETTPKQANNKIQFLGETTPKQADNESKFLGETTPNESDRSSKFLGETTPNESDKSSKFLGETTPTEMNNQSNFLGETTPNESDRSSKFLGETTPNEMNNQSQFLGETTPLSSDRSSKFLGETTPNESDKSSKFLGETTPSNFTFSGKLENEGKEFREVNNITDIHAKGFTSRFGGVEATKFVGVNKNNTSFEGASSLFGNAKTIRFEGEDTKFDRSTSLYGNFDNSVVGLSFTPGYGLFKRKTETGNKQRYTPDTVYRVSNELTNKSISKLQEMRSSPSFLDEMYHKFNLRDDAFNLGTAAFAHPLILRGIQRKKMSKGEPQKWGFGFSVDDGLVRGGIVTSLDRAVVDAVRLGKWMVSVQGLLWGIKNLGLQQATANVESITGKRKTKIWTPVNTLAATLGGFAGLHPNRHGITPFDLTKGTYSEVLDAKKAVHKDDLTLTIGPASNRLVNKWNKEFQQLPTGEVVDKGDKEKLLDKLKNAFSGGPNSLYGLGDFAPNQSTENTIPDEQPGELGRTYNQKKQYYSTNAGPNPSGTKGAPFEPDNTELGLNANNLPGSFLNNEIRTEDGDPHNIEKKGTDEQLTIRDYETIAYGKIPKRGVNDGLIDFRSELTGGEKERANKANYKENRLEVKSGFNTPGKVGEDRTDYTKDTTRFDAVQALRPVATKGELKKDLVKFYLQPISKKDSGDEFYQFRGTVNGITETFSPSWDSLKFSGRADQGYKYSSFERSVSFNFKMWATSRTEMKPMYEKLEALSTFTMPLYRGASAYQGILVKMTLGDLYVDKLTFIESLSYTFPDEAPWDVNLDGSDLGVRPMGIDISIGFKILDDVRPEYKGQVYDLGWRQ